MSEDDAPTDSDQAAPAPTTSFSLPTVATSVATTSTVPSTTIEKVTVPRVVGMPLARAKDKLADRGLTAKVTYKSTARFPAGTVISQSRKAGAGVLPDTTVSLVVAKAPPPPPSTAPPEPPPRPPLQITAIPLTRANALRSASATTTALADPATVLTICKAPSGWSVPMSSTSTATAMGWAANPEARRSCAGHSRSAVAPGCRLAPGDQFLGDFGLAL